MTTTATNQSCKIQPYVFTGKVEIKPGQPTPKQLKLWMDFWADQRALLGETEKKTS